MSRRKAVVKHNSEKVQGEGSWVKMQKMRLKDYREMDKNIAEEGNIPYSIRLIKELFVEWNWADEDENLLPGPAESPEVLDNLTAEEFQFLCSAVVGSQEDLKN